MTHLRAGRGPTSTTHAATVYAHSPASASALSARSLNVEHATRKKARGRLAASAGAAGAGAAGAVAAVGGCGAAPEPGAGAATDVDGRPRLHCSACFTGVYPVRHDAMLPPGSPGALSSPLASPASVGP